MTNADDLFDTARALVEGFAISQVGDNNELAELEVQAEFDELDDPDMLYSVIRIFSTLTAAFARVITIDRQPGTITAAALDDATIATIRHALHTIDWKMEGR